MSNTLTLRPVRAQDHAVWHALWTGYLAYYETTLPETIYETAFSRLLGDDPQDFHGLIAWRGDTAVGLTHFVFHRHLWRVEHVCYLQDLYTLPAARGTGVGRALIEAVYAAADAKGCPAVYWMTQEFNTTARQLYDRIATKTPFIKYARSL